MGRFLEEEDAWRGAFQGTPLSVLVFRQQTGTFVRFRRWPQRKPDDHYLKWQPTTIDTLTADANKTPTLRMTVAGIEVPQTAVEQALAHVRQVQQFTQCSGVWDDDGV